MVATLHVAVCSGLLVIPLSFAGYVESTKTASSHGKRSRPFLHYMRKCIFPNPSNEETNVWYHCPVQCRYKITPASIVNCCRYNWRVSWFWPKGWFGWIWCCHTSKTAHKTVSGV